MNRKGDLIFWEIRDFHTTKEKLTELGFDRYVPRNDFKSAMVKVLMQYTKGNNKLYRRFNDKAKEVSFGVFGEDVTDSDIHIRKELIIKLDKEHGNLTLSDDDHPAAARIRESYRVAKETLDSRQIRSLVKDIVKYDCYGISMRQSGGIYFVDQRFDATREKLTQLFNAFPTSMRLHTVPIYDDAGTVEAIEYAAKENIFSDIDTLVKDIDRRFKDGSITKRQLEGDKARIKEIMDKITVHRDNLRGNLAAVEAKLETVERSVTAFVGKIEAGLVEPGDFMSMLEGL